MCLDLHNITPIKGTIAAESRTIPGHAVSIVLFYASYHLDNKLYIITRISWPYGPLILALAESWLAPLARGLAALNLKWGLRPLTLTKMLSFPFPLFSFYLFPFSPFSLFPFSPFSHFPVFPFSPFPVFPFPTFPISPLTENVNPKLWLN